MNFKFLTVLLLLVLVCSLLFEIGDAGDDEKSDKKKNRKRRKGRRKGGRKRKNKTSTTAATNVTLPLATTEMPDISTIVSTRVKVRTATTTTAETFPLFLAIDVPSSSGSSDGDVPDVSSKGLFSIFDYMLGGGGDDNSTYVDGYDYETTTAASEYDYDDGKASSAAEVRQVMINGKVVAICIDEPVKARFKGYVNSGDIGLFDALKIAGSGFSKRQKIQMMNSTLNDAGLPPIAACTLESELDDNLVSCDLEAVAEYMMKYAKAGTLSIAKFHALMKSNASEAAKLNASQQILRDEELPKILPCLKTPGTVPPIMVPLMTVPLKCDEETIKKALIGYVTRGELAFTILGELTAPDLTPIGKLKIINAALVKANLPMIECTEKGGGDPPRAETTTALGGPTSRMRVTGPAVQLIACNPGSIRALVISHIGNSTLPNSLIPSLTNKNKSLAEKLRMINNALLERGRPIIVCSDRDTKVTTVPTVDRIQCDPETLRKLVISYIKNGILSDSTLIGKLANQTLALSEKLSAVNHVLGEQGMQPIACITEEEEVTTVAAISCDEDAIRALVISYIKNGILPGTIIGQLMVPDLSPADKLATINNALEMKGAQPIVCAEKLIESTTGSPPSSQQISCDPESIKALVTSYMKDGIIPYSLIGPLKDPEMSEADKLYTINEALLEAGLAPIECSSSKPEKDSGSHSHSSGCSLLLNTTDHGSILAFANQLEEAGKVPEGTYLRATKGELKMEELLTILRDAHCADVKGPNLGGSVGGKDLEQLNKLMAIIDAGYLPQDTLTKLALGEISQEWLRANLSKNEDFILSQLPAPIAKLIRDGDMPPEIVAAIFGGTKNQTEIIQMLVADDDLIRKLLPDQILLMLGEKPVPDELKQLMVSGKNATEIREEVQNDDDLLRKLMSPSSYFFYNLFQSQMNRDINSAISICVIVVLTFVMVSLGCTMTVDKIAEHARKPKGVVIALFAQFVIMPASAFGLTQAFDLDTYSAISVLICGCCPGGNLSNMLAYALNGDMNLSILMTTCSSIIGLGMMPFSLWLYSRFIIPLDSGVIPFEKIILNIALTVLPVGIGIAIRHFRPTWVTNVMRFGAVILVCCTITVAVLAGIMLGDSFFLFFNLKVLACCAILPMAGYVLGYTFAFVARETPKCRRTICVETGCQNVQLCSTVLKLAFDPILVGVLFLMPLVYMAFQTAEAFLLICIFRLYNRLTNPQKLIEEECGESEEKKRLDSNSGKGSQLKGEEERKQENGEAGTKPADEVANNKLTEAKKDSDESDIVELWPLNNTPTPAYLDSFKAAGTENYV